MLAELDLIEMIDGRIGAILLLGVIFGIVALVCVIISGLLSFKDVGGDSWIAFLAVGCIVMCVHAIVDSNLAEKHFQ